MDDLVGVMVERESWNEKKHSGITGGQLVMWEETLECRWISGGECCTVPILEGVVPRILARVSVSVEKSSS